MKDISFRIWDNAQRRWLDCDVVYDMIKRVGVLGADYGDRYSIEQFSGIRDVNGQDIYEGDIVEFLRRAPARGKHDESPRSYAHQFPVRFENGEFACGSPGWNWLTERESGCEMRVVGNVHQQREAKP